MRTFGPRFSPRAAALLVLVSLPSLGRTQSSTPDPVLPRITSLKGGVTVKQAALGADTRGVVGLTLSEGDQLVTSNRARAELQFDDRVFQIAANTEVRLVHVESGSYQLQLDKGSFTCQVLDTPAAAVEVRTPSVAVRPAQVGLYRMTVTPDGESEITAYEGNIEVFAPGGSEWVLTGHKMIAHGPADNPEFKIVNAISKWRRVLTVALMSIRVAADVSAIMDSGSSGSRPEHRPAATSPNTATQRAPSDKPPSAPKPADPPKTSTAAPSTSAGKAK